MSVLLRANVPFRFHRRAAHRTTGTTGRNQRCRFLAQVTSLAASYSQIERFGFDRLVLDLFLHIVRGDNNPVERHVESKLESTHPKLMSSVGVERTGNGCRRLDRIVAFRKLLQHLLDGHAERLNLLFLHPENVRFAPHKGKQTEPAMTWFAERFDLDTRIVTRSGRNAIEWICHRDWVALPDYLDNRRIRDTTFRMIRMKNTKMRLSKGEPHPVSHRMARN